MERRDFVGAVLALFTWTAMPAREIEMIHLFSPPMGPEPDWMGAAMKRYMNAQLYAPQGVTMVTHIGEPAQQEYAAWFSEQQEPHQFQV